MILVDTSVWIDHLRTGGERLRQLLHDGQVLVHVFVVGELALGNLINRDPVLESVQALPKTQIATEPEVFRLIGEKMLWGSGIGYIDAHLLAAVLLTPGATLWTRDRRLLATASRLGIAASTAH